MAQQDKVIKMMLVLVRVKWGSCYFKSKILAMNHAVDILPLTH